MVPPEICEDYLQKETCKGNSLSSNQKIPWFNLSKYSKFHNDIEYSQKKAEPCRIIVTKTFFIVENNIEKEFKQLADQWRKEVIYFSSVEKIVMNLNYQKIIGMGSPVIPLILRELNEQPDDWFYALRMITRENPIRPEDKGDIKKMAQTWIEWGKLNNYL
jgi:hypothetical protein